MASLIPSALGRNWWDFIDFSPNILDQHFGVGLTERDLCAPTMYRGYAIRPRIQAVRESSGKSEVKNDKDKFEVTLDVSLFKPEEIEVKVVGDYIVVHGKHEERSDQHGLIEREFTRRYALPEGAEAETVTSSFNSNGFLSIVSPKKAIEAPEPKERVVPVVVAKPNL